MNAYMPESFVNMVGLGGALLAGYAYLPQITHLFKERCTAGISRRAFSLWLVSSVMLAINAIYIRAAVFIVLGVIQVFATATIIYLSTKYKGGVCEFHARGVRAAGDLHVA